VVVSFEEHHTVKFLSFIFSLFFLFSATPVPAQAVQQSAESFQAAGDSRPQEDTEESANQRFSLDLSAMSKEKKAIALNLAGAAAVVAYGAFFWNYSLKNPYHTKSEGWFGAGTNHGGVDKCGHFYVGYLMGDLFSYFYDKWGFERERSALLAFLSSMGFTTVMEIGDGFSEYGSSPEDMVANITGAGASYLLHTYPALSDRIDLRVEYRPSGTGDISTDYAYMKFLLALKAEGFPSVRNKYLKFLELHFGYYATGYEKEEPERERNLYVGVGFNFSRLVRRYSKPLSTFLHYYQIPYTYVKAEKTFRSFH
jgi:hypothetical protein